MHNGKIVVVVLLLSAACYSPVLYHMTKNALRRRFNIRSGGRGGNMTFWEFGRWGGSVYRRKAEPMTDKKVVNLR